MTKETIGIHDIEPLRMRVRTFDFEVGNVDRGAEVVPTLAPTGPALSVSDGLSAAVGAEPIVKDGVELWRLFVGRRGRGTDRLQSDRRSMENNCKVKPEGDAMTEWKCDVEPITMADLLEYDRRQEAAARASA